MEPHPSDSREQQRVEGLVLEELRIRFGHSLDSEEKPPGLKPDGFNRERRVIVEVYAHQGPLKGGQIHKVKADVLKMILLERELGDGRYTKILALANGDTKKAVERSSWFAAANKHFQVKLELVELPDEVTAQLVATQKRQRR